MPGSLGRPASPQLRLPLNHSEGSWRRGHGGGRGSWPGFPWAGVQGSSSLGTPVWCTCEAGKWETWGAFGGTHEVTPPIAEMGHHPFAPGPGKRQPQRSWAPTAVCAVRPPAPSSRTGLRKTSARQGDARRKMAADGRPTPAPPAPARPCREGALAPLPGDPGEPCALPATARAQGSQPGVGLGGDLGATGRQPATRCQARSPASLPRPQVRQRGNQPRRAGVPSPRSPSTSAPGLGWLPRWAQPAAPAGAGTPLSLSQPAT